MKQLSLLASLVLIAMFTITGCKKENASHHGSDKFSKWKKEKKGKRPYKDNFDTWFNLVPDLANGWDPQNPTPYLAWYPGGGTGKATHMGNAYTYFNQYVPFNPPTFSSVPAPVTMFFSTELAAAGLGSLSNEVSSVVFDGKGNSVWFHQTSNATTPLGPSRIEFTGTADIIGGSGKFKSASGEVALSGYFNPQDNQDAAVAAEGWICY